MLIQALKSFGNLENVKMLFRLACQCIELSICGNFCIGKCKTDDFLEFHVASKKFQYIIEVFVRYFISFFEELEIFMLKDMMIEEKGSNIDFSVAF